MRIEYKDLILETCSDVYEPSEDSFLIAKEIEKLDFTGKEVLEIGTGTGLLSLIVAKKAKTVLSTDINPSALKCAEKNAKVNKIKNISFLKSDLFENITDSFDVIIFNPPYIPTESEFNDLEERAWVGGKSGRKITDRFLSEFEYYMNKKGIILILQSSLSNIEKTLEKLKPFNPEIISSQKLEWEKLVVIKAHK